jgi:myo-inositol-1(or 4)-monophosphatase
MGAEGYANGPRTAIAAIFRATMGARSNRVPSVAHRRALARTARTLAAAVGAYVARAQRRHGGARRKGVGDFVTRIDLAAEERLRRALRRAHPDHGFLGEETGAERPDAELCWVVDPIDGTSNYAHGLRDFAVSIACLWRGQPMAAAVACGPGLDVYAAAHGLGARTAGRRLALGPARLDDAALVGVQWHRGSAARLDFVASLIGTGARLRVLGSTVVQMCAVADGRLHANVQQQGRLWDYAAAALIVTEAGGVVSDWAGQPVFPVGDVLGGGHVSTIAAGRAVHRRLLRLRPFGAGSAGRRLVVPRP